MKSAGEILKDKRLHLGFSTEHLATKLKIQEKYLIALEQGDNSIFDSKVIARGFLKKYCKALDLDEEKLEAFWRRDFNLVNTYRPRPKNILEKVYITPKILIISFFGLFAVIIISITLFQYYLLKTPPVLLIETPKDGVTINSDSVVVKGKSDSKNEVYLNNKKINLSDDGRFSENIYLTNGYNKLSFKAISAFGVETNNIMSVYANYSVQESTVKENVVLRVVSKGTIPTFLEVKDDNKEVFSGFLMPTVSKEFKGNSLFLYSDSIENLDVYFNGKKIEVKEAGTYTNTFSLQTEEKEEE